MEGSVSGRTAAARRRLSAPRSLKASKVGPAGVTLRWNAPKGGAKPAYYVVLRDGKSLGKVKTTSYTDSKVGQGRTYRYAVRAYDSKKRAGALSSSVRRDDLRRSRRRRSCPRVADDQPGRADREPRLRRPPRRDPSTRRRPPRPRRPLPRRRRPSRAPRRPRRRRPDADGRADRRRRARQPPRPPPRRPLPTATATATPAPPGPTSSPRRWSTGCLARQLGPTQAQRDAWKGKTHAELVDWFLNTPSTLGDDATKPKPLTSGGNCKTTRWGLRHSSSSWTGSTGCSGRSTLAGTGSPSSGTATGRSAATTASTQPWSINYRNRLLKYADFGTTPALTFKGTSGRFEMTTLDSAMSMYLNMNQNVRGQAQRELRARVHGAVLSESEGARTARDNYTQDDVAGLAKAFTGWRLNGTATRPGLRGRSRSPPSVYEGDGEDLPGPDDPARDRRPRGAKPSGLPGPGGHSTPRSTRSSSTPDHSAVPDPQAVGRVHRLPDPAADARQPRQRLQKLQTISCTP